MITKSFIFELQRKTRKGDITLINCVWVIKCIKIWQCCLLKIKECSKPDLTIQWEILITEYVFGSKSSRCILCISEKLVILQGTGDVKMLNKRQKLIFACRHRNEFLIKNIGVGWFVSFIHCVPPPLQHTHIVIYICATGVVCARRKQPLLPTPETCSV